ncbi:MAG: flagellar type III secretion system protein FliR [Armatimonadetes bacterium]|nr:flagellar type III secretion system protein FliR [Armatimonadota bacterium]
MLNYEQMAAFLLVFTRVSTFLAAGPLFWLPNLPRPAKAGLAFMLAVVLFPVVKVPALDFPGGLLALGLAAAREACVGLLLGFVCSLVMHSLTIAGQLMDIQMGFFMSYIFDPTTGAQATIASRFLYLLGMVLFFTLDGHHVLLAGLARSFELVPVLGATLKGAAALSLIRIFAQMIALAVQIAAPIIAVMLIIDLCLGILGRTSPEMNIFMLGFPVKVGIGILLLSVLVPLMGVVFRSLVNLLERNLLVIMKGLA